MNKSISHIILKTESLNIGYEKKNERNSIASNIDIEINESELVAVIGINGIGKSTLLRSLSRIQRPLSGKILIKNIQIEQLNPAQLAASISLVLTEQPVSRNLKVFELVALGRQPYTNWIGKLTRNDLNHILESLQLVGIEDLQNKKCYELSDGQFQKVLIARALAQNTSLIILDEPTTHLDMYHKAYVLKLLKRLTRETKKAIVFASHEINLALQLCDKIILMEKGRIQTGSPGELIKAEAFSNIFPSDLIFFDAETSSFKIRS